MGVRQLSAIVGVEAWLSILPFGLFWPPLTPEERVEERLDEFVASALASVSQSCRERYDTIGPCDKTHTHRYTHRYTHTDIHTDAHTQYIYIYITDIYIYIIYIYTSYTHKGGINLVNSLAHAAFRS